MRFGFKLSGQKKLLGQIIQAGKVTVETTNKDIEEMALAVHSGAIKSIQAQGSGRMAMRYGPKRRVKVSDPGQPPNTDQGTLVRSIMFTAQKKAEGGYVWLVGTALRYGADLEFGTSKMAARPWLLPAFLNATKRGLERVAERLQRELKRIA